MTLNKLFVISAGFVLMAGCSGTHSLEGLTKEEAREIGKADWSIDHCAENGWYGDGNCDDFCPLRDPDCPRASCRTDEGCEAGASWCENGSCVPCDNSGMFCDLTCPYGFEERNGCTPCRCAEFDGCVKDEDCESGSQWCENRRCVECDNSGHYCYIHCHNGFVERNGCRPCICAP